MTELPADHVLNGEYRIRRRLGSGGFGITYEAENLNLKRRVAIKEYFPNGVARRHGTAYVAPQASSDPEGERDNQEEFLWGLERFSGEAQTLARFRDPGVVSVLRHFLANNTAYMEIEFIEGADLRRWMESNPKPPGDVVVRLVERLLRALEVVHAHGILHRDIKPMNIMIRPSREPVLIDFGSARAAVRPNVLRTRAVITTGYSPPEQYDTNPSAQGDFTDIYALGATCYHLVTGDVPMEASQRYRTGDQLVPAVVAGRGRCPESLLVGIDQALRLASSDRPQSIAELRGIMFGEKRPPTWSSAGSIPSPAPKPPPEPVKRSRWRIFGGRREAPPPPPPPPAAGGPAPHDTSKVLSPPTVVSEVGRDLRAWSVAGAAQTIAAWQDYAREFPQGLHTADARRRIEERKRNRLVSNFGKDATAVQAVAVAPDGRSAVTGLADGRISQWRLPEGEESRTLTGGHTHGVFDIVFTPRGTSLLTAGGDGKILHVNHVEDSIRQTLSRHEDMVHAVDVSPNGMLALSGGEDRLLYLWDVERGGAPRHFFDCGSPVWSVAMAPDGRHALVGCKDGRLIWFSLETLTPVETLMRGGPAIVAVAVSGRGSGVGRAGLTALAGTGDGRVHIWGSGTPTQHREIVAHEQQVRTLAVSADGRSVVTGGGDRMVKIWSTETGQRQLAIEAHRNIVTSVALVRQLGLLVTASQDGAVRLWDVSDVTAPAAD